MPAESHKPDYPPFFLSFFRKESALHCLPATEESPVVNPVVNPTGVFHRVFHQGWGWTACTRSPLALPCPPGGRRRGAGRGVVVPVAPSVGGPFPSPGGVPGVAASRWPWPWRVFPPPACRGAPDGPGADPPRLQRGRGERAGRWYPAPDPVQPSQRARQRVPPLRRPEERPPPRPRWTRKAGPRGRAGPLSGRAPLSFLRWAGILTEKHLAPPPPVCYNPQKEGPAGWRACRSS